jgi:hypothetical protein
MNNASHKLTVTAVQHDNGVITAFVNQLPGLVVQANSNDDIKIKLQSLLKSYIKRLQAVNNFDIQTRNLS